MNLIERAVARLGSSPRPSEPVLAARADMPWPTLDADAAITSDSDKVKAISGKSHHDPAARAAGPLNFGRPIELPLARLRDQGFLIPAARATATGQEFRLIKGPLLEKAFGTDAQRITHGERIAITSALPGEGKTFCAINLAISIAASGGRPVLLIDADVARPSVAEELGIQAPTGLIDIINGEDSNALECILPTNIDGLAILPAGKSRAHAGEGLANQSLASFLDRLSADLRDWLFIIDTPPLLAVTETRTLMQQVGQIVMVVAAGETPRRSVNAALATITGAQEVSLVLNKVPESSARLDYYYGY